MIKVIGGILRGRKLKTPKGRDTRPVLARIRESLFSVTGDLHGISMLDLFAGTGAVGIEAISRGASSVVFVEKAHGACVVIRDNLTALSLDAEVVQADLTTSLKTLEARNRQFGFIFADPPYGTGLSQKALDAVFSSDLLEPPSLMALTVRQDEEIVPAGDNCIEVFNRRYGDTRLLIFQRQQVS